MSRADVDRVRNAYNGHGGNAASSGMSTAKRVGYVIGQTFLNICTLGIVGAVQIAKYSKALDKAQNKLVTEDGTNLVQLARANYDDAQISKLSFGMRTTMNNLNALCYDLVRGGNGQAGQTLIDLLANREGCDQTIKDKARLYAKDFSETLIGYAQVCLLDLRAHWGNLSNEEVAVRALLKAIDNMQRLNIGNAVDNNNNNNVIGNNQPQNQQASMNQQPIGGQPEEEEVPIYPSKEEVEGDNNIYNNNFINYDNNNEFSLFNQSSINLGNNQPQNQQVSMNRQPIGNKNIINININDINYTGSNQNQQVSMNQQSIVNDDDNDFTLFVSGSEEPKQGGSNKNININSNNNIIGVNKDEDDEQNVLPSRSMVEGKSPEEKTADKAAERLETFFTENPHNGYNFAQVIRIEFKGSNSVENAERREQCKKIYEQIKKGSGKYQQFRNLFLQKDLRTDRRLKLLGTVTRFGEGSKNRFNALYDLLKDANEKLGLVDFGSENQAKNA